MPDPNHVADTYRTPGELAVLADEQAVLDAIETQSGQLDESNLRSEAVSKGHLTTTSSRPPTHGPFYRTFIVLTSPTHYAYSNTASAKISQGGTDLSVVVGATMARYDVLRLHANVMVWEWGTVGVGAAQYSDHSWFKFRINYNSGSTADTVEMRCGHGNLDTLVYTSGVGNQSIERFKVSLSALWFNPTGGDITVDSVEVWFRTEDAANAIHLGTCSVFALFARN